MIIRTLADTTVVHIHLMGSTTDAEFLAVNPTGGYSSVDSLPESKWGKWKVVNSVIVFIFTFYFIC